MNNPTLQDWLDRGYRRFEIADYMRSINKNADFMLQKRFDDERGKKYYITVYCYDRSRYPEHAREYLPEIGFMTDVQFQLGDHKPFFNITINAAQG